MAAQEIFLLGIQKENEINKKSYIQAVSPERFSGYC